MKQEMRAFLGLARSVALPRHLYRVLAQARTLLRCKVPWAPPQTGLDARQSSTQTLCSHNRHVHTVAHHRLETCRFADGVHERVFWIWCIPAASGNGGVQVTCTLDPQVGHVVTTRTVVQLEATSLQLPGLRRDGSDRLQYGRGSLPTAITALKRGMCAAVSAEQAASRLNTVATVLAMLGFKLTPTHLEKVALRATLKAGGYQSAVLYFSAARLKRDRQLRDLRCH